MQPIEIPAIEIAAIEIAATDPAFAAALAAAGLPADDIGEPGRRFFAFHDANGAVVGYGGVELPGDAVALLRSLVVAEGLRGRGFGQRIVRWLLDWLAVRGVDDVWMLTTTAMGLGERCGFRRIDRSAAPATVKNTRQFASLCPTTAILMRRQGENTMKKLEVYDPAMCCSTGVCGPDVDPALVAFAADLKWAAEQGVVVQRYNLGQEPQAFAANPAVVKEMEAGMDRLPIIAIDGHVVSTGVYLSRDQLAAKLALDGAQPKTAAAAAGSCCAPKSGCC